MNLLRVIVAILFVVEKVVGPPATALQHNKLVYIAQGSSTKQTVYCGSKQPSQKDFALIINHKTGEFVLERLTYKLNLKRYAEYSCNL